MRNCSVAKLRVKSGITTERQKRAATEIQKLAINERPKRENTEGQK
jgi:hypothetical protein